MPTYRHMVTLPYADGLPENVAVNVFHTISDDDTEAAAFADLLVTFYQAIDNNLLSNQLSAAASACSIKTYNLSDPEPRSPTDTQLFTLTPGTGALPPEVALCMSFQGIRISGQPQARRRGRVFIGPLTGIMNPTSDGRPDPAKIAILVSAADALLTSALAAGIAWAVYSPTDAQAVPVQNGWVDNEFDVIRERGRRATTRSTFS